MKKPPQLPRTTASTLIKPGLKVAKIVLKIAKVFLKIALIFNAKGVIEKLQEFIKGFEKPSEPEVPNTTAPANA